MILSVVNSCYATLLSALLLTRTGAPEVRSVLNQLCLHRLTVSSGCLCGLECLVNPVHPMWTLNFTVHLAYIYRQVSPWFPHQTTNPFVAYDLVLYPSPTHNFYHKQCLPHRILKEGKHVFAAGKLACTSQSARANNLSRRGRKMVRHSLQ